MCCRGRIVTAKERFLPLTQGLLGEVEKRRRHISSPRRGQAQPLLESSMVALREEPVSERLWSCLGGLGAFERTVPSAATRLGGGRRW